MLRYWVFFYFIPASNNPAALQRVIVFWTKTVYIQKGMVSLVLRYLKQLW